MKINWPIKFTTKPIDDETFWLEIAVRPWLVTVMLASVGIILGFALVDAIDMIRGWMGK